MPRRMFMLTAALVLTLAELAHADVIRKDFLTFNACGAIHHDDNDGCQAWGEYQDPDSDTVVKAIKRSIDNPGGRLDDGTSFRKPEAVMLQELCFHQYDELRTLLPGYDSRFEATGWNISSTNTTEPNCDGTDKRHGLAVFSAAQILETDVLKFVNQATSNRSDDGKEDRKMLCVKVNWTNPARVCSTHLAVNDRFCDGFRCNDLQAAEVEDHVEARYLANRTPVVVGGDFNANKGAETLNHMYAKWIDPENSGHGSFKEVDQADPACRCGENTLGGSKYDYIFVSQDHWSNVAGDATDSPVWSDHHLLWGKAELTHSH